jgi:ATP-binding cassette subfamily B multidrug efflux pump
VNIHQEKELEKVKDTQLISKLIGFTLPYWKTVAASIVMAGLIVAATLAQPYIIKVAIDDRINGMYRPMLQVDPQEADAARREVGRMGLRPYAETEWNGHRWIRVRELPEGAQNLLPESTTKAQIVSVNGRHLLVHAWIKDTEDMLLKETSEGLFLTAGEAQWPVTVLENADVQRFREGDYAGFVLLGGLFLLAVLVSALLNYFQSNSLQNSGQRVIFDIRQRMFDKLARMHNGYFDKNPVGRMVTRVSNDVEALNNLYSQVIVNLVKEVCMVIGIIIIMFQLSVKLTLVSFFIIPVIAAVTFLYRYIIRDVQRYTRLILSRLNSFLAENLSGMRIIQLFTREEKQMEQFNNMNNEYYRSGMKGTALNSIFNPAIGFLGSLALALIVWQGGKLALAGGMTFGVIYAFTHYIRQFYQPLLGLADRYQQIQMAMVSAERIFELIDEKSEISSKEDPVVLPSRLRGRIDFDRVWFAYNKEDWVLKDVTFRIEPGEKVAFVGATGAGKTSVISLINRFYDIQKGSIRIDGTAVSDAPMDQLRRKIGLIQQEPFVFTGDVDFNIRLHRKDITREQVMRTARELKLDEFIEKLPQKYDTPLGEQGLVLSSGQKQLLSFLRAAVCDPDVLILDEATAHIDTETERIVQQALQRVSAGRTTLIIAHRLSTIRDADKIIVMHKGQVQEVGSHDSLMRQRGFYFRLHAAQRQSFSREARVVND